LEIILRPSRIKLVKPVSFATNHVETARHIYEFIASGAIAQNCATNAVGADVD
jgi:hypothetical protein